MHSSQFNAIALFAADEGNTITAMHFLPGATLYYDGALVVMHNEIRDRRGHPCYAVVSMHVGMPPRTHSDDTHSDMHLDDLHCGDRTWMSEAAAMNLFNELIQHDITDNRSN